jgi:hypothetical protein
MERDQAPPLVMTPALVVGGNLYLTYPSSGVIVSGGKTLQVSNGVTVNAIDGSLSVTLGGDPANGDILRIDDPVNAPLSWRLKRDGGDLVWTYANSSELRTFRMTGQYTTATFGRQNPVPYVMQFDRLFVGTGVGNARQITNGYAPPTDGEWGQGDFFFNLGSGAGQPLGWTCTVAGTPGTWTAAAPLTVPKITPWAPLPIASGAQVATDFEAPGAQPGSEIAVAFDEDLQGVLMWAQCITPGLARAWLRNDTGGTVTLASGHITLRVRN